MNPYHKIQTVFKRDEKGKIIEGDYSIPEFESEKANKEEGYIFGMWYSVIVPGGELGTNHLSRCHPLPDDIGKAIISLISLK